MDQCPWSARERRVHIRPTVQVTGVTYGSGRVVGYQYDPLGNLTQKVDNGTADNYTANALNQYTFINSQALSYDAKGNLLQRPGWAYTWDAHNRLRSAAPASPQSGSLRLTFSYDGRNRCAVRRTYTWTEGAWQWSTTLYLTYSDWNLLEERDSEGTLAAAYVHGPEVDDVIARLTPTSTIYYHADASHSTVAVTGAQGDVLERYTYDIFGLPTVRDGASYTTLTATAVGNRVLFQGREWLAEAKLTDHRYRLYSSEMQRWLNRDPIGEIVDRNLYRFVESNPASRFDPLGLWTLGFGLSVNFQIGPININGSAGIVLDGQGNIGTCVVGGGGVGAGGHASGGISFTGSNAQTIFDLSETFANASVGAGAGLDVSVEVFGGNSDNGTVMGGGFTLGAGLGVGGAGGGSYTFINPCGCIW